MDHIVAYLIGTAIGYLIGAALLITFSERHEVKGWGPRALVYPFFFLVSLVVIIAWVVTFPYYFVVDRIRYRRFQRWIEANDGSPPPN